MKFSFLIILISFIPFVLMAAEFMPERPDAPDNALSLGRGEFYIESEVLNVEKGNTSKYTALQSTLRYGMSDDVELLINQGGAQFESGEQVLYRDFYPRIRWNHLGNEGGWLQLATIYGVNLPLDSRSSTEWLFYFGVPFAFVISDDYYLAATIDYNKMKESPSEEKQEYLNHSWALFRTFWDDYDVFVQMLNDIGLNKQTGDRWFWGGGLAWRPTDHFQVDFYVNDGLNSASADITPAIGFAKKF